MTTTETPTAATPTPAEKPKPDKRSRAELLAALAKSEESLRRSRGDVEFLNARRRADLQYWDDDREARRKDEAARNADMQTLIGHLATAHKGVIDARFELPPGAGGYAHQALQRRTRSAGEGSGVAGAAADVRVENSPVSTRPCCWAAPPSWQALST